MAAVSCSFAVTGLSASQGWQNGGTWVDMTGAGFAKGMKVTFGGGRASVRVVDSAHATALTPAGPVGFADVTIALAARAATLRQAFLYKAGALRLSVRRDAVESLGAAPRDFPRRGQARSFTWQTMRAPIVGVVALSVACGAAHKKVEDDTGSLPEPAAASSADMAAPPDSPSSAKPAASSAAAPAARSHPTPSTSGAIDGKPFAPKLAVVAGPIQKDGRALVALQEKDECVTSADAKPGDQTLTMMVAYGDGMKTDLAALKLPKGKSWGDFTLVRVLAGSKNEISTTVKPIGTVTIVKAPMKQGDVGTMKIDLTSGGYMLNGDIDLKACSSPK